MNVLIVDFDPFANTGGGQTVYRNIVLRNPAARFWYYTRQRAARPGAPNAEPIYYRPHFTAEFHPVDPTDEAHYSAFLTARNFAYAARGRRFDVVDVPDYYDFAAYLRPALREFDVRFERLVVSLHGRLSETRFINWEAHRAGLSGDEDAYAADAATFSAARQIAVSLETAGLRGADARYAISAWYIRHLQPDLGDLPVERLCPWNVLESPTPPDKNLTAGTRTETLFVGRFERAKGPDLFVDLAWLSGAADFGDVAMLGADEFCQGAAVSHMLMIQARKRNLPLSILPAVPRNFLLQRLEKPCLVLAPSRFETFGLVPLEALLRGALVGYTRRSGLADFIRTEMPELVRAEFDPRDLPAAAESMAPMLRDFARFRAQNVDYLAQLALDRRRVEPPRENAMFAVYNAASCADEAVCDEYEYRYTSELATRPFVSAPRKEAVLRRLARTHLSPHVPVWVHQARWQWGRWRRVLSAWKPRPRQSAKRMVAESLPAMHSLAAELRTRRGIAALPRPLDAFDVLRQLAETCRAGRIHHFYTLAMAESRRRNTLLKHLYLQRIARWTGTNKLYDCHRASGAYQSQGFSEIATVLPWLCPASPQGDRDRCVLEYLSTRVRQFPMRRRSDYDFRMSHVSRSHPRVSIVVSLYNAENKLDKFVSMLARADLVRARAAEVIFVDSGSARPQFSSEQLRSLSSWTDLIYLRTAQRETIAAAWNRGLAEARGEYIVCLGADEMVTSSGLGKLADYLDRQPHIDWVTANSIVINVSRVGRFVDSPLVYDRSGMTELSPIVDPTYVNYVGGMYRRRIHEKCGGYDTSFRAASDTEFKHRIFPYIRSAHLNETLGVFLDYPESRMTAHPRAEAEDLRALYLFRTLGGLRYLLQNRCESQTFDLLRLSLCFRRSYAATYDTDFDLAANAAALLAELNPGAKLYRRLCDDVSFLRDVARRSDCWRGDRRGYVRLCRDAWRLARVEKVHRRLLEAPVYYHLFNDVRYSMHCNVWPLGEAAF